jgi:DnaJ-class molecular chaperone
MSKIGKKSTINYYEVLAISHSATPQEIRKAYHKLVKIYHPDRLGGLSQALREQAGHKMKEINKAYSVLSQAELRIRYDMKFKEKNVPWVKSQAKHSANPLFSEGIIDSKSKLFLNRLCSSFYSLICS